MAADVECPALPSVILNPFTLYALLGLGAIGVCLALPRPRVSPQLIGGLIVAIAFGGVFVALGRTDAAALPGPYFYIFSFISLMSGLRVITHPRPVYAALYFIITILSSSVLYVLLQAEFLAFALIIIYAGAILITYVFVIMLATQAPTEDQLESLSDYDSYSREPLVATALGFVLLAVLTTMLNKGVPTLQSRDIKLDPAVQMTEMPRRLLAGLEERGIFAYFKKPPLETTETETGLKDLVTRTGRVELSLDLDKLDQFAAAAKQPMLMEMLGGEQRAQKLVADFQNVRDRRARGEISTNPFSSAPEGAETPSGFPTPKITGNYVIIRMKLPSDLVPENVESVGFALVAEHPMALELAGVILLMAMLGAVVLARKHVELSDAAKAAAARSGGSAGGLVLPGPRGYGGDA